MIQIDGYRIKDELYNGSMSIIYRAVEEKTNRNVVIKLLKAEYPSKEDVKSFIHEFNIAKQFDNIKGIVKNYEVIEYRNTKAIIMEDFGGTSLEKIIKDKNISIKSFLEIAVKCSDILSEIHKKHIIHKDIKPHNILLNQETGEVKIIDFGISTQLTKETQKIVNPEGLEGTLSYISPEQTGRMNRSIDYRTDIYSLGVTFYELLTKKLPFETTDPMELVHSHIAKIPDAVNAVNSEVPEIISKIVMKMMEKTAENRYQSCLGIKTDLEKCYIQLKDKGSVDEFEIGENDLTDEFRIPEKLYGRENEINHLMNIFNKVSDGGRELIFISGLPGIGKSALINELHKPITEKKGYFIKGKFEQLKKNIPYSALIQAFQDLVRELISEPEEKLKIWKEKILESLTINAKLLTDVIPELELIIGKQSELMPIPHGDSQNRFNLVFQNFIKIFTKKEHPLVLFIDDLQWADSASLNLIKILLTDPELNYFLFLGSYRNNEVNSSHPFTMMHEQLLKAEIKSADIKLDSLNENSIEEILKDTFHSNKTEIKELASLIKLKTSGNPFFVMELLNYLYENSLIKFDNEWKWDIKELKGIDITDNVVDFMVDRLNRIPTDTLNIIKIACCLGDKFYLGTLSLICGKSPEELLGILKQAFNKGLLVISENTVKFIHDRVREAAYLLIDENEKKKMHYTIGKTLLNSNEVETYEDRIFTIANQLNLASDLLDCDEKSRLIKINYASGKKAELSAAFSLAGEYFSKTAAMTDEKMWESDYDFLIKLYTEYSELEYINSNYENAEKLFSFTINKAINLTDKIKVYRIMLSYYETVLRFDDAIELSIKIFRDAGINFKSIAEISQSDIQNEMGKFYKNLGEKNISELIELPYMTDPLKVEALIAMASIITPFWMNQNQSALPYLILTMVNISMEDGLAPPSAVGFGFLGVIFAHAFGFVDKGNELGLLSLEIIAKFNYKPLKSLVMFLYYNMGASYLKNSFSDGLPHLLESYNIGCESGSFQWAGYSLNHYCFRNLWIGTELSELRTIFDKHHNAIVKINQPDTTIFFNIVRQGADTLLNKDNYTGRITGEYFEEESGLPFLYENKYYAAVALFNSVKIMILSVLNNIEESYDIAEKGKDIIEANFGQPQVSLFKFFSSLAYLRKAASTDNEDIKKECIEKSEKLIEIIKNLSESIESNYIHLYTLLKAELNGVQGNTIEAMKLYDQAINHAKTYNFIHIEALANECAGIFYLSNELDKAGLNYLIDSIYCYEKWGAKSKVELLIKKYPQLASFITTDISLNINKRITMSSILKRTSKGSNLSSSSVLDIAAIVKATQVISSEIEMEKLLSKLITTLIENAGAQNGALILKKGDDQLTVEAQIFSDSNEIKILHSIPVDECDTICPAIVRYVSKIKENIILEDAVHKGKFTKEKYIIDNQIKSLLCIPIVNQGNLIAILYLENNLATAVFTPSRVETLNVLSSQAAISIENARLIDEMKDKLRLQQEMAIAEKIQTSLCPDVPEHDELLITTVMKTAEEVGGDYYDIVEDKEKNTWFAVGDVSGHGVTPGLIMMMAETSFNVILGGKYSLTPADAIIEVNRVLNKNIRERLKETHFMTMCFLKYTGNGNFTYAGSHLDIIVWRAAEKKCELFKTEGLYLSIIPDISHITRNFDLTMKSGDIMVLYTDGLIESGFKGDKSKIWGIKRLCETIEQNAEIGVEAVKDAVVKEALDWCDQKPNDDITMIVIEKK